MKANKLIVGLASAGLLLFGGVYYHSHHQIVKVQNMEKVANKVETSADDNGSHTVEQKSKKISKLT